MDYLTKAFTSIYTMLVHCVFGYNEYITQRQTFMVQNSFLRWLGLGILALVIWLFFPFLKSFFVALLMALASRSFASFFATVFEPLSVA